MLISTIFIFPLSFKTRKPLAKKIFPYSIKNRTIIMYISTTGWTFQGLFVKPKKNPPSE